MRPCVPLYERTYDAATAGLRRSRRAVTGRVPISGGAIIPLARDPVRPPLRTSGWIIFEHRA